MTAKCVAAQQEHIQTQHDGSHTNAEISELSIAIVVKKESAKRVIRKKAQEKNREIQKVPMNVLQYQRQIVFAQVAFARLANSATWRVSPKSLVIGPAIVITRHPKSGRKRQDQ